LLTSVFGNLPLLEETASAGAAAAMSSERFFQGDGPWLHCYMVWKNFNFGKFGEKTFVKIPAVFGKQKAFRYNGPASCKPAFSWCFLELTGLSHRYTPGLRAGHATAKKWSGSLLHVDPSLTITLQWPGMKLFQEPSLAAAASNQPVVCGVGSRNERCWMPYGCMANILQYIETILNNFMKFHFQCQSFYQTIQTLHLKNIFVYGISGILV